MAGTPGGAADIRAEHPARCAPYHGSFTAARSGAATLLGMAHSRFAARRGLGVLLACALPVGGLVACGQDLTGTSSTSARDALYFNDRASGLPPVYLQEPYSTTIEVAGGAGPYTVRRIEGTFPPGLNLTGTTLSGTPTKAGTYTFTLEVTDSTLSSKQKSYTVTVQDLPPLSLALTLPAGQIRGETRVPVTITAPRSVRAARFSWTLPANVTVTRVQPEGGALLFWRQDGTRLTLDLGFKAVPRSGARVALISVKPGAPITLGSPDLGYEARGGDGKVLAQKLTAAEQKTLDEQKAAEQKAAQEKAAQEKAAQEKAPEAKPGDVKPGTSTPTDAPKTGTDTTPPGEAPKTDPPKTEPTPTPPPSGGAGGGK